MKRKLLIILLMLSIPVFSQDKKPHVRISAENSELNRLLRDELTSGNIAVTTTKRGDYEMTAAISPLGEDTGCRGVIGVLLIEGRDGRQLSVFIASDPSALTRQMAERIRLETKRK